MARETVNYATEQEMKQAKLRSGQRHKDGWRPLHTDKTRNGWRITWSNDPDPPDPKKTEKDRIKVLQGKILDDSITTRELVEYERLRLQ